VLDVDTLIADCIAANREGEPLRAISEILTRAVSQPEAVAAALPPVHGGISPLHVSPELTILNIVWAPRMTLAAHDHRMWAAIALYSGGEDNTFYRRDEPGIVESGGKSLQPRDVCLLGSETIHAVTNPTSEYAGAIHVYGGDFFATARSEWAGDPLREQPYDVSRVLAVFAAANLAAEQN
jgi:predicted metal-dependent enzyme (double-stranded beta helix superfamily)